MGSCFTREPDVDFDGPGKPFTDIMKTRVRGGSRGFVTVEIYNSTSSFNTWRDIVCTYKSAV